MAHTTRIITASALLIASVAASAQQDAVKAIHHGTATPSVAKNPTQSQDAATLAGAIDAYNAGPTAGAIAPSAVNNAMIQNTAASPASQRLARAVRAYNGELAPAGDTVDYSRSPDQRALALGREVTQFNRSGGSLDVVGRNTRTLQ